MVDTLGLLLAAVVHPADIQDRDGARLVLERLVGRYDRLQVIWADGAYGGKLVGVGQAGGRLEPGIGAPSLRGNTPSKCCPAGGSWNGPSVGSTCNGGSVKTTKHCAKPPKPGCTSL